MIKVKANEELFNQWQKVGRIISNLASIVQNDMEIEAEELAEWEQLYLETKKQLNLVYQETMNRLQSTNDIGSFVYQLAQAEAQLALKNLEKEQES